MLVKPQIEAVNIQGVIKISLHFKMADLFILFKMKTILPYLSTKTTIYEKVNS